MPLGRDEHEALLSELLQEELTTSRKTEILQTLRSSNVEDHETFTKLNETLNTLKTQKEDLVVSNSMLFRKLGVEQSQKEDKKQLEEKTFSETVRLEDLLK